MDNILTIFNTTIYAQQNNIPNNKSQIWLTYYTFIFLCHTLGSHIIHTHFFVYLNTEQDFLLMGEWLETFVMYTKVHKIIHKTMNTTSKQFYNDFGNSIFALSCKELFLRYIW